MVDEYSDNSPLPETIRLGNMQISPTWVGCAVIDDLYESSYAACKVLEEGLK
ncbi:MAG: hypothetical protein QOH71_81 [Blastocatellia bacterium]|jgi:hypothetical protein|nr:hypothetical protein [Blastocatellia bacterium]